jgi:hypothetical protein
MNARASAVSFCCVMCAFVQLTADAQEAPAAPIEPPQASSESVIHDSDDTAAAESDAPRLAEFQADEIGLVLRTLARQARINLVVSEAVQGTVTLRLESKTPREAIDVIAAVKGLILDEKDGVLFVKTRADLQEEPVEQRLARQMRSSLPAVAQFKGEYYRQLAAAGLPEGVARQIVLEEKLSDTSTASASSLVVDSPANAGFESRVNGWLERVGAFVAVGGLGLATLGLIPQAALHVALAIAVFMRSRRIETEGGQLVFFGPVVWALATLVGGVFLAAFYWFSNEWTRRSAA